MKSPLERYYLRKKRVQKKIRGKGQMPRLSVYRSLKHIYAQIIDDVTGKVIVSEATVTKDLKNKKISGKVSSAVSVGESIAQKALATGITQVVFDRGGWPYHGRIKALAESARKAGLKF